MTTTPDRVNPTTVQIPGTSMTISPGPPGALIAQPGPRQIMVAGRDRAHEIAARLQHRIAARRHDSSSRQRLVA